MNYKALSIALLGLFLSSPVNSGSIYKCTKTDKSVVFTDKPCPANSTATLVHKESEQEIQDRQQAEKISRIRSLIEGNQINAAKEYAAKNNLSEHYFNQLSIYSKQKNEEDRRTTEDEKQQQLAIEQQKLALQKQQLAAEKAKAEAAQHQQQNNQNYYGGYPYYYGYPYFYGTYGNPHYRFGTTYSPPSQQGVMPGTINPHSVMPGTINPQPSFPQRNQQYEHRGRR